jgi:broad specificity phosphatase PhoE
MEVIFVRHGESTANDRGIIQGQGDYPLSEKGLSQALKTKQALLDFSPHIVFTSNLVRAVETAQIINRSHNARVIFLEDLSEYDLGEFEGLTYDEIVVKFPFVPNSLENGEQFHLLAPGGEKDEDVDIRARRAFFSIMDTGAPRILVVAHLGILERILFLAADEFSIPDITPAVFPLKNCSLTHLEIHLNKVKVIKFNDDSHLGS